MGIEPEKIGFGIVISKYRDSKIVSVFFSGTFRCSSKKNGFRVFAIFSHDDMMSQPITNLVVPRYSRQSRRVHVVGWIYRGTECGARLHLLLCSVNPFRTAVPLWGQTTQISSSLSPKRDCGSKRVNRQQVPSSTI